MKLIIVKFISAFHFDIVQIGDNYLSPIAYLSRLSTLADWTTDVITYKAVHAFKQAFLHGFTHRFARPAALLFCAESVPVSFSAAVEEHFASTRLPVEIPTVLRSIAHDQIRTSVMRQVAESRSTGYIRDGMKQNCVNICRQCLQLGT